MRLLVCGGRDYADHARMDRELRHIHYQCGITVLVHGATRGADSLAGDWAAYHGVPVLEFVADWTAHGRAAGPMRNQRMLDEGKPDLVLAFSGGRGTADMVRRAKAAGVAVREVGDAP